MNKSDLNDKDFPDLRSTMMIGKDYKNETYKCNHAYNYIKKKYNCDKKLAHIINERNRIYLLNCTMQELKSLLENNDNCMMCKKAINQQLMNFKNVFFYTEDVKLGEMEIGTYTIKNLITYNDIEEVHKYINDDKDYNLDELRVLLTFHYQYNRIINTNIYSDWLNISFPYRAVEYALGLIDRIEFIWSNFGETDDQVVRQDIKRINNICTYVQDKHKIMISARDEFRQLLKLKFGDYYMIISDYFCLFLH